MLAPISAQISITGALVDLNPSLVSFSLLFSFSRIKLSEITYLLEVLAKSLLAFVIQEGSLSKVAFPSYLKPGKSRLRPSSRIELCTYVLST